MVSPLTQYRKENGLSRDDLSATIGVDAVTLWRWEKGRVPAERVREVERLTGIPRAQLRPDLYEAAQ